MCGRAADPRCVLDGALQIVMWLLSGGQHSVHYEQYSVSTEMTIQYGFARGKMLVRMKARRYTVTTRAAPCLPRPSCPRITCSRRHHLRRSPPSSSCNSLQERSPSLSIKPLCPTALQQYSSSCCFQPPSFCRERACGLPCFASRKTYRQISCATSHFSQLTSECQSP